jgi:phosphate transport system substrate-binding protein
LLAKGLRISDLKALYVDGKKLDWKSLSGMPGNVAVSAYTRSDASGAAETWAKLLGKKQEDLKGVGVFGDPGIAEAVRSNPNALGYNNLGFAYDLKTKKAQKGLQVVPIDFNENGKVDAEEGVVSTLNGLCDAISKHAYPEPPARGLFLATKGKATGEVANFLQFVLTTGSKYVVESGFVVLADAESKAVLAKLQAAKPEAK